jgi:hypothetical protein
MKKLLLATTMLCALASGAKADILGGIEWTIAGAAVLSLDPTVPAGNQVNNLPCIICGANQPLQPTGFGYNLFGNTGNADTVAFFSTSVVPTQGGSGLAIDQYGGDPTGYAIGDGSLFKAALAGSLGFSVGIDVNDTNTAQTLESFWFLNYTTKTVLAVYSPGPGGTLIADINNGTGFPDWTLSGFTLEGINPGDLVGFYARITGANDGPDSFFIQPFVIPGPVVGAGLPTLLAGCLGLLGLGTWRRRRQQIG